MKNMTKVLVSVALSGSLFVSTLGDSASAAYNDLKKDFGQDWTYDNTFVKSDSGISKNVNINAEGHSVYVILKNGDARRANFNIVLSNGKRLKIKNGLFYSKGKAFTGTVTTKKVAVVSDIYPGKKEYYQVKMTIKNGKFSRGTSYKKLYTDSGVNLG